MSNSAHHDENGGPALTPPEGNQPQSWPKKVLMFGIVLPVVLFWETTKGLYKRTYRDAETDSAKLFNLFIGVVLALVAGIGTGYNMGWGAAPASLTTWLSAAVGTAAAMFFYGWTIANVVVFKHASKAAEQLWARVNLTGESYETRQDGRHNPEWFSAFLLLAARVASVLITLGAIWIVMQHVQSNQSSYFWLGYIMAVASVIVAAIAAVCIVLFVGHYIGGFVAFLLTAFIFVMLVFNWAATKALWFAAYNGLTADTWGDWGYIPGLVVASVVAFFLEKGLWKLIKACGVPLIAVILSLDVTYALLPATQAFLSTFALSTFSATLAPYIAAVVEFFLLVGFVFPLAHIAITHGLKKLANITKLMEAAYQEEEGGYREFFLMVVNLAATTAVFFYVPSLLLTYVVSHTGICYAATALIGLGVYTLGGKWLLRTGVLPFAMVVSAYVGYFVYGIWPTSGFFFAEAGGVLTGILSAVASVVIGFPLAYLGLRSLLKGWLAAWLRNPLVNFHTRVCENIGRLVTEFLQAARHTYGDESRFRETFQQLANIAVTVALTYATWFTVTTFGFAFWLGLLITATKSVLAYLLVGQLFKKKGNGYIGLIVAIFCGVYFGIIVHGSQPFGYWLSVPGGLVGAALTAGAFFPWAYLFLRVALNAISQETWLHPALVNTHAAAWNRFANLRQDFLKMYRQVRDTVTSMKENFWRTYEEMRAQIFKNWK